MESDKSCMIYVDRCEKGLFLVRLYIVSLKSSENKTEE